MGTTWAKNIWFFEKCDSQVNSLYWWHDADYVGWDGRVDWSTNLRWIMFCQLAWSHWVHLAVFDWVVGGQPWVDMWPNQRPPSGSLRATKYFVKGLGNSSGGQTHDLQVSRKATYQYTIWWILTVIVRGIYLSLMCAPIWERASPWMHHHHATTKKWSGGVGWWGWVVGLSPRHVGPIWPRISDYRR